MLRINIQLDDEKRAAIKSTYGKDDYGTIDYVMNDIVSRYLNADFFDKKLFIDKISEGEMCEFCGEKSKYNRMIDIDGRNLIECKVCENCGSGNPGFE